MKYSRKYIDHFTNPRGVGEVEPADRSSEVHHEGGGCFDKIRLTLKIDDGKIIKARFRARACSGTIAACSALMEMVDGLDVETAKSLTSDYLIESLESIPDQKMHSVELAIKALSEALNNH